MEKNLNDLLVELLNIYEKNFHSIEKSYEYIYNKGTYFRKKEKKKEFLKEIDKKGLLEKTKEIYEKIKENYEITEANEIEKVEYVIDYAVSIIYPTIYEKLQNKK